MTAVGIECNGKSMKDKNNKDSQIVELMSRSTDDATARPVFLVMRRKSDVSMSAYKYICFDDESGMEEFSVNFMAPSINLNDWMSEEEDLVDDCDLADYFAEHGYSYEVYCDIGQLVYWENEDEIKTNEPERVFWTREEANYYCGSNPDLYSFSVMTGGVLSTLMDFTCEREIERLSAEKEGRSSKL